MRESRLRWYGHVIRKDQEYVERRMTEIKLREREKRGAEEKISGCSNGGYGGSWCEGEEH